MTLFIYGDVNRDLCLTVREVPAAGADAEVTEMAFTAGGSAANTACIAARLGTDTQLIGLLGDDEQADSLLYDLVVHDVRTHYLRRVSGYSGMVTAIIDTTGERTFLSYRGVNARLPYGDLPANLLTEGDHLHISGYSFQTEHSSNTAIELMAQARQAGASVSLDTSYLFARDYAANALISRVDYLIPNEEEARLLTGQERLEEAAEALVLRGVPTVLIKAGARGCYLRTVEHKTWLPAYPVTRIVDTIGAGDAFCGGFIAATLRHHDPVVAARIGMAAASLVIQQVGGHTGAPTWEQVLAIVNP
ncbi:MAG: carbohydrate kinase family protein [Anaerolineae bacterium]|nr:carbohydrate kinase family protein [Anaerolineae bacterium]